MTPPVPIPPRSAPRRLRLAAQVAVFGLALATPFAATPPEVDPRSPHRPATGHTVAEPSTQTVHAAPPVGPPRRAPRRVERLWVPLVVRPASGPVSSPFGWRRHPVSGRPRHHDGADLAVPLGSTVRAVASGVVRSVGRRSGYGLVVEIDHEGGLGRPRVRTLYAHLSSTDRRLHRGARVGRGQPVGASGGVPRRDGLSTGPHLHFEVRDASGRALDPAPFLGAISARQRAGQKRWQVMFSSGRKPLATRPIPHSGRPARAAFTLPSPAGSRGRERRPR